VPVPLDVAATPADASIDSDLGTRHAEIDAAIEPNHVSDAGGNTLPPPDVVLVPLFAKNGVIFEVFENGVKVLDGPDNLEVPRGEKRTVVIKAKGFRDKTVVVNGTKKRVLISLVPLERAGSGSAHSLPQPPGPNCANEIVDPNNKACVAQYCAKHSDDVSKCGLE
jgi:hypothetical protein